MKANEWKKVGKGLNIAICDDSIKFINDMRILLSSLSPNDHIIEFSSGFALLEYAYKPDNKIDILVLDMVMPHFDGIETARELRKIYPDVAIIVATAYPQYALPCYDIFPIHFLVKPITLDNFKVSFDRARRSISEDYLLLQTKSSAKYVALREIICVESHGLQTKFTLESGTYKVYQALDYYDKQLASKGFFRIHRNTVVNLERVSEVINDSVLMGNSQTLKVARRRKNNFMTALVKWRKAYA